MIFISQFFYFRIIYKFLNSQASLRLTIIAILRLVFTILARTLNSRGNEFANISENHVLANISESTVSRKVSARFSCKKANLF